MTERLLGFDDGFTYFIVSNEQDDSLVSVYEQHATESTDNSIENKTTSHISVNISNRWINSPG